MKYIKSIICVFILIFIFWPLNVEAFFSIDDLDTQITPTSSSVKIEKIQNLFFGLWLYEWKIDWNYDSIEKILIDYQLNAWIIENPWDWWAWYFWDKTAEKLLEDYWDKFKNLALLYIKKEEVVLWERYFIVTAYYSPLPNQEKYLRWTYEADIKLNWNGKITASWEWVFPWLLAAPTNYDFGTKIKLDWVGIGVVADRWWAIVNAWEEWHEYDRIDIWMWYWDDWLERALKWWKREIIWEVVTEDYEVNVEFDISPITLYEDLTVDAENPDKNDVVRLQELFNDVKLYDWKIDWEFNIIKDELIKFQIENNIISSSKDDQAWYFWKKTLAVLRKKYWWWIFNEPEYYEHLSLEQKQKIQQIRDILIEHIDKKSNWNNMVAYKYKQSIRTTLDWYISLANTDVKRQKIEYLKDIF